MSFETQGNQTFWRDIPEFCRDIPAVPEKFEKKVCVQFSFPIATDIFVAKYTGMGSCRKEPGVLSKVQMLNLVLGVGVFFSLLPNIS